jgi:hypothetical protein
MQGNWGGKIPFCCGAAKVPSSFSIARLSDMNWYLFEVQSVFEKDCIEHGLPLKPVEIFEYAPTVSDDLRHRFPAESTAYREY